ncbi:MAG: tetratricopeptide repeat protein, partial [Gemmatimonadetes bacterium]|nr:tetratricopeptide repeat protein [Gemmatimonadota bacterium]
MAAASEIEKLESRYAENPEGRYFAPLADAYRKAGRVDDALQLVRRGLEKHPDYLSAHIVLGRCQLDKKDDGAASDAFQAVLALDPENIIALKSLAEISERIGETLGARRWLQKLLAVDSMNADAEADLGRLGGPVEAAAAPEPAAAEAQAEDISFADIAAVAEAPTEPFPALPAELVASVEATAPAMDFLDVGSGPQVEPEQVVTEPGAAMAEEFTIDLDRVAEEEPGEPSVTVPQVPADLPLIMPEDVTPPEELARPSSKLVQVVFPAPDSEEGVGEPPTAEPMVTETMGDLYLKQGFRAEAADVYRRLLAQRPEDAGLAAKLAALEAPPPSLSAAALGAESVGVWLRRVAGARLPAPSLSPGPAPAPAAAAPPSGT